jgi:hypothetical protein
MAALDTRHDMCVRALLYRIESEIVIAEGDDARESLEMLRDALFPTGAVIVQRSYIDQAGEAKLRAARLTTEMRGTLAKLKTLDGRTAESLYEVLQSSARALGEGELKRAELGVAGDVVLKTNVARNQWIRVVNAIASFLAAEGIGERSILGAIRDAEAKAERRKSPLEPPSVPTPEPNSGG